MEHHHRNVTCSPHDVAEKNALLTLNNNHSLTQTIREAFLLSFNGKFKLLSCINLCYFHLRSVSNVIKKLLNSPIVSILFLSASDLSNNTANGVSLIICKKAKCDTLLILFIFFNTFVEVTQVFSFFWWSSCCSIFSFPC